MQPFHGIDFSKTNRIVAAVSGGGDSLALLALLRDRLGGPAASRILAVTVDHGLRAESAAEARQVATLCAGLGVEHRTVRWQAPAPATGLQAEARAARYALLAQAARDAGASMVLTGHTADDQLETVTMRAARGSGPGLAGIAPATFFFDRACASAGIWFLRPLLRLRRSELRSGLRDRGLAWIEDPSNEDPHFERVRTRRALSNMSERQCETLLREQTETASARHALEKAVAELIQAHAREVAPGLIRLDGALLDAAATDAGRRAIAILLAFAGGTATVPDADRLRSWAERLGTSRRATLARCVAEQRGDVVYLRRENRGVAVSADGSAFDNRYGLCGGANSRGEWLMPVADEDADFEAASGVPVAIARQAARLQPVLRSGSERRAVWRSQAGLAWYRILNPWPDMVPLFDLATARAVSRLAGAPDIPPPPLAKEQADGNEVL